MRDQDKLDQVVDEIARITGRNVSLDDVFSRVLAYNTSLPTTDRARIESVLMKSVTAEAKLRETEFHLAAQQRPFVLPGNPEHGLLARVCVPLVFQGLKAGYLWILARDEEDPPQPILEAVLSLGDRIEQFAYTVLEAIEPVTRESVGRERALLAALHGQGEVIPEWLRVEVLDRPTRVAVLSHPALLSPPEMGAGERTTAVRQAMSEALRAVHARVVYAPAAGYIAALLGPTVTDLDITRICQRFGQSLTLHGLRAAGLPTVDTYAGLSLPAHDATELPERFQEAMVAAQAGIVDPALPNPTMFVSVGVYQYLAQLEGAPASTRMSAISAAANGEELLDMLEQVYDSNGPRNELAAELHIHRTSLYHRLRRIGKVIGDDPLSSSVRLDLHLALKARRWAKRPKFNFEENISGH